MIDFRNDDPLYFVETATVQSSSNTAADHILLWEKKQLTGLALKL